MESYRLASIALALPAHSLPLQIGWYERWGKRAVDVALATCALLICAPVLLLAGLLIAIDSPGPIIYRQKRVGLRGEEFEILKLRTMMVGSDKHGCVTRDKDPRITRVGKWLRLSKIDELPQIINILRGDMSIVGARPLSVDECSYIEELGFDWSTPGFYPMLRPGLIGLEQANRHRELSYRERFLFNSRYESNVSWKMDLMIFFHCLQQCRFVCYAAMAAVILETAILEATTIPM